MAKSKRMKEFQARIQANKEAAKGMDMEGALDKKGFAEKRMGQCEKFFDELAEMLQKYYTVMPSSNKDNSRYLVPNGTENKVTYYGKPLMSFRVSNHWNWYTNRKNCNKEDYVQCNSLDMPEALEREAPGKATKPIYGFQVCIMLDDGKYHLVYGNKFNRTTNTWKWVENRPEEIIRRYHL